MLLLHMQIEETIVYPAASRCFQGDLRKPSVLQSFEEHELARQCLSALESTPPTDEHFVARAKVLKGLLREHIFEEENELFPSLATKLGQSGIDMLGDEVERQLSKVEAESAPRPASPAATEPPATKSRSAKVRKPGVPRRSHEVPRSRKPGASAPPYEVPRDPENRRPQAGPRSAVEPRLRLDIAPQACVPHRTHEQRMSTVGRHRDAVRAPRHDIAAIGPLRSRLWSSLVSRTGAIRAGPSPHRVEILGRAPNQTFVAVVDPGPVLTEIGAPVDATSRTINARNEQARAVLIEVGAAVCVREPSDA